MSMVQLIVPVMMQQDQLIVCKAPVDWMKASVIHENTAHVLSLNYNPVFLPVDRADISTGWNCKEVTHKADGHPYHLLKPLPPRLFSITTSYATKTYTHLLLWCTTTSNNTHEMQQNRAKNTWWYSREQSLS